MKAVELEKTDYLTDPENGIDENIFENDIAVRRAKRVMAVCSHFSFKPLDDLTCVDLGLSSGTTTNYYAKNFKNVISLSGSPQYQKENLAEYNRENIQYICSSRTEFALPDGCADVVICNQLYEHIANQDALMSEIYRILKYGGFCYFCARNRYVLLEGPYFLPFLYVIKTKLQKIYSVITRRKTTNSARLLSLSKLVKLTRNFWRHDYTSMIFQHPENFAAADIVKPGNLLGKLPNRLFSLIYPFFPAWIWVLTKKK
jgi:SAM-dependent methyltransferase